MSTQGREKCEFGRVDGIFGQVDVVECRAHSAGRLRLTISERRCVVSVTHHQTKERAREVFDEWVKEASAPEIGEASWLEVSLFLVVIGAVVFVAAQAFKYFNFPG